MWGEVKWPDSKGIVSPLTRRHAMKGNGTEAKTPQRGKSSNNSKARVSNPREVLSRRGFLSKGANPREMLVRNPKKCVSIATRWGTTPKSVPRPNREQNPRPPPDLVHNEPEFEVEVVLKSRQRKRDVGRDEDITFSF
jgi:hypothetical protein